MAQSWRSKQLANERDSFQRLKSEIEALAGPITQLINRYATETDDTGAAIIPNTRESRQGISRDLWTQIYKPYFIGSGFDPLNGPLPQSPYMNQVVEGIVGGIRLVAEQQVSIINKFASPVVRDWLTGPRPFGQREMLDTRIMVREQAPTDRRPWYDPYHMFVNPNGYRLSDNGWRTSIESRRAMDNLLTQGIIDGTSAVKLADQLVPYLWPGARKVRTSTPYGSDGSYWARRLSRTEITAGAGRSFINASLINPYIEGVKWNLSASHPCCDICDDLAAGGENGDGVYAKNNVPSYPAHPHELCYLTAEVTTGPANINAEWERLIAERTPEAVAIRGAFNLEWLIAALINGWLINTVFEVVDLDVFEMRAA